MFGSLCSGRCVWVASQITGSSMELFLCSAWSVSGNPKIMAVKGW